MCRIRRPMSSPRRNRRDYLVDFCAVGIEHELEVRNVSDRLVAGGFWDRRSPAKHGLERIGPGDDLRHQYVIDSVARQQRLVAWIVRVPPEGTQCALHFLHFLRVAEKRLLSEIDGIALRHDRRPIALLWPRMVKD